MNCFIIRLHLLNQINVFWGDHQKRVSFVSVKDAIFSLCQLFTSEKQFASGVNSLSFNITLSRNNRDCTVLNKMEIRRVAVCTQMSLLMFALIHVYRLILCLQSGNLRLINLRCANLKSPCQAVHWLSFRRAIFGHSDCPNHNCLFSMLEKKKSCVFFPHTWLLRIYTTRKTMHLVRNVIPS